MMRPYLVLGLSLSLVAFGLGCSENGGTGGSGGTAGTGGGAGGMGGSAGTGGVGGTGGTGGTGDVNTKQITFGCANSFNGAISIIPGELTVEPGPIEGGSEFAAAVSGRLFFPQGFLDVAQTVVPGGVPQAALLDARVIVQVRSGATLIEGAGGAGGAGGAVSEVPGVILPPDVAALVPGLVGTCVFPEGSLCDPTMDNPDGSNPDCMPVDPSNFCTPQVLVDVPTSDDCAPDGFCDVAGKSNQCTLNGYCVSADLELPLLGQDVVYAADASGQILFGWADQGLTNSTLESNDIYTIPTPSSAAPIQQGIKVGVGAITVGIECVMAVEVDDGGDTGAGLTPDSALLSFDIP